MDEMEDNIGKLQASYNSRNKDEKPRAVVLQYTGSSSGRSRALGTPSNPFPVNSEIVESPMPAVEVKSENVEGPKKRFQRVCPNCKDIINVRRHVCYCGYSFVEARRKAQQEKEAHQEEMGKRAAKFNTLSRSLTAIKKHSSKLRGGGYHIAVVYFKVQRQRTTKGILPGSGLSKEAEQNIIKWFYLAHTQDNRVIASSAQPNEVNEDDLAHGAPENLIVNYPKQQQEDTSFTKCKKKGCKKNNTKKLKDSDSCPNAVNSILDQTLPKCEENQFPTTESLDMENSASSSMKLEQAVIYIPDETIKNSQIDKKCSTRLTGKNLLPLVKKEDDESLFQNESWPYF